MFDDLGLRLRRANHALIGAQIERLAGDPEAAERELRSAREVLAGLGARAVSATHTAVLADTLCTLHRMEEAETLAREAADSTPDDDIGTKAVWHSALARALVGRGSLAEARRLVDIALQLSAEIEFPDVRLIALTVEPRSRPPREERVRRMLYAVRLDGSRARRATSLLSRSQEVLPGRFGLRRANRDPKQTAADLFPQTTGE